MEEREKERSRIDRIVFRSFPESIDKINLCEILVTRERYNTREGNDFVP